MDFSQHAPAYRPVPEDYYYSFRWNRHSWGTSVKFPSRKTPYSTNQYSNLRQFAILYFCFLLAIVLWDYKDEGWDWQAASQHEEVFWGGLDCFDTEWPEPTWGSVGILPQQGSDPKGKRLANLVHPSLNKIWWSDMMIWMNSSIDHAQKFNFLINLFISTASAGASATR